MPGPLIEVEDVLVDELTHASWLALEERQRNALMAWVNAPRLLRRRRARQAKAIAALRQGTENWDGAGYDVVGGFLEGVLTALFPW